MNNDSQQPEFDPHAREFSSRDWTIMAYFAGLGIIPLIAILVVIYVLYSRNPNFENFPEPPKPQQHSEAGSELSQTSLRRFIGDINV